MGSNSNLAAAESFLKITSRVELADWLGTSDAKFRHILYGLKDLERYQTFHVPKRNGTPREIKAPIAPLKNYQRQLLDAFVHIARPHSIAKGFVAGRSIVDHAKLHRNKRWVILVDLKDFFPSINFGRVLGAFRSKPFGFEPQIATVLAQLCCSDGCLPQGAPTSPILSNLIALQLDKRLLTLAREYKCVVSRYADDICFSTNCKDMPSGLVHPDGNALPGDALSEAIVKSGFQINSDKFHVVGRRDRQLVTGLVVNRKVGMPRFWRRQLRFMLFLRQKFGNELACKTIESWSTKGLRTKKFNTDLDQTIAGKGNFLGWLDEKNGTRRLDQLVRTFPKAKGLPRLQWLRPVLVLTEGASDRLHLNSALQSPGLRKEYSDFNLKFAHFPGDANGDKQLWQRIRWISKQDSQILTVAVFDCDHLALMQEMQIKVGEYRYLGGNAYVLCLADPGGLSDKLFCIEDLFARGEITSFTAAGRRIFFKDEFDAAGVHQSGMFRRSEPSSSKIVVEDKVFRTEEPNISLTLSKLKFAELVQLGESPFTSLSFSGFRPTFDILRVLVEQWTKHESQEAMDWLG